MPIYQYQCQDCGHQLEALQKISDPVLTDCPACNSSALKKQLTAASFQLKGTGWYATDFKDKGNKPASKNKKTDAVDSSDASKSVSASNADNTSNSSSDISNDISNKGAQASS